MTHRHRQMMKVWTQEVDVQADMVMLAVTPPSYSIFTTW